jgi:hypothetical protein
MATASMTVPLHVKATVQPGHRVIVENESLPEGVEVEVVVTGSRRPSRRSMLEILASTPAITRTPEERAEFERQFQGDRDSWDR